MTTDQFTSSEPPSEQLDPASTGQETHPIAEAGREAGESAGHLAERAANIGIQQADRGREQAASGLERVAKSIRRVSDDFVTQQPAIADAADTAADKADDLARYLRETDAREMISNVEDMARRQPLVFVGGAFVLGFVTARFIKAAGGSGDSNAQQSVGSGNGSGRMRSGVTSLGTHSTTGRSGGEW
jgi:hypothetical protein